MSSIKFIEAILSDAEILTELTIRSKAYWGYSSHQIEKWKSDLTVTESYISECAVFVLIVDDEVVGYYSYYIQENQKVKLDNMFLEPKFIGMGFGKQLMNDFLRRMRQENQKNIVLDSEPGAEAFYQKFGFTTIGKLESSIVGRFLPIMELSM